MKMDAYLSNKRCTCLPKDVNNYPDVAMSTDSYFPRHKSAQTAVRCFSEGNREARPCSSVLRSLVVEEVEDERSNSRSAFHRDGEARFNFDEKEHCDIAPRRWQVKFVNNNNNNNNNNNSNSNSSSNNNYNNNGDRRRLFRANDEIAANTPSNQVTPRVRNCQNKCPGSVGLRQSFSKTDESGDFKDVFDSFEMLNRNHANDSVSLRSSLSDEQIVSFQIPSSRKMRKMRTREVKKERIKDSPCLRLTTTTNKYGILVAILCFIVVVFVLVFLITWTAFHRKEQCIPPSEVQSNFGSPWAVAMNNWSTDEDGEGWGVYRDGGSRYKAFDVTTNFEAAQVFCESRGGHLPRIETIREQVFIEEYLQKSTKSEIRAENHQKILGFWIGGRRPRGSHGGGCMFDQWKWVDLYGRVHGSISGFTAFAQGKPDNIFDPEECLYIVHEEGLDEASNFKWDDTACDVSSLGGIKVFCEVELR